MKENGNTKKKTVRRIRALVNEYQLCWSVDLFVEVLSKQNKLKEAKSTQRIDTKIIWCYFWMNVRMMVLIYPVCLLPTLCIFSTKTERSFQQKCGKEQEEMMISRCHKQFSTNIRLELPLTISNYINDILSRIWFKNKIISKSAVFRSREKPINEIMANGIGIVPMRSQIRE
jgi:hypothetical protein